MFARWGGFIYRFRKAVFLITVALALASLTLASKASGELTSGGWLDPAAESSQVSDRLSAEFGSGKSSIVALFKGPAGTDASSPTFQAVVTKSLARVAKDARVVGIVDYATTGAPRFISTDKTETYAVIQLSASDDESVPQLASLRSEIDQPEAGVKLQLTGYAPVSADSSRLSETDLARAESISIPIALIILTLVFGSLVAASLPLLVAGLAIPSALGLVYVVAQHISMSVYVLNISSMLGLALAIDYSLFLVSRFREELKPGRTVEDAVVRAVATSGKAVVFSGVTVAIGVSGLFLLKAPALASIGIGGAIVVLCSVFYAMTFLPAVLGMLGPRVSRLSLRWVLRRLHLVGDAQSGRSRWDVLAHGVMSHPVMVLLPVLVLLLLAGTPALGMDQGVPGASIFKPGMESRDAFVALRQDFAVGETSPIVVLADVKGDPAAPENVTALAEYADRLAQLPDITKVEGPFSGLRDPSTGAELTTEQVANLYRLPAAQRPPQLQALYQGYVRGSTVQLDAISSLDPSKPVATKQISAIRAIDPGHGIGIQVGGVAAIGHDFLSTQNARLPLVVGVVLGAMLVILFLLFGSIVLPIKAVLMTLLSLTASFGALVWVFQDGNLQGLLDFQSPGYTIAGNPIIMFCFLFGLSMDYEVLLLSRVQEAYRRTGNNTEAVAEGLTRTAGVITGAALIMVSVFSAFVLANVVTIKSLGVGMAVAVLVDASIIRVLLVPATMRLLGRWNWYAPGPLGKLADRVGFSHIDDRVVAPAPAPDRLVA